MRLKRLMLCAILLTGIFSIVTEVSSAPAPAPEAAKLSGIDKIIASKGFWGGSAFALDKEGTLWSWGSNFFGQFGSGIAGPEGWTMTPHSVPGLAPVQDFILGNGYYMALQSDGTVMAWGMFQKKGKVVSPGRQMEVLSPQAVPELTDVVQLSAGRDGALAVKKDGTVWLWNNPAVSEEGYEVLPAAVKVQGLDHVKWAGSGRYYAALRENGTLWLWGTGSDTDDTALPRTLAMVSGLYNVKSVTIDADSLVALTTSGDVWASTGGWNSSQTGVPQRGMKLQKMTSLSGVVTIQTNGLFNLVRNQKGEYWVWSAGTVQKSLQKVASLSFIKKLELNLDGFAAIRNDGTVWEWKHIYSETGKLSFTPPKQIKGLYSPKSFAAGENSKYAVLSDGTAVAWGTNMFGQLGISSLDRPAYYPLPILRPVSLIIDGKSVKPVQPPVFRDGRVYVPLRDVAQSLGYNLSSADGIISLTKGSKIVKLYLDENKYVLPSGSAIAMGDRWMKVSYTMMVPAGTLAQALSCSAQWEGSQYRLTLKTGQ